MENAWLDSLSEDWVSQPRSDGSQANTHSSLPAANIKSEPSERRGNSSRIPLSSSRRQSTPTYNDKAQLPLNERSINDKNIPASKRASSRPSKLNQDILSVTQGPQGPRTTSVSSVGSIRHHTVHHKSSSLSPKKPKHGSETPEWKRRLLHGEVAYGEQRDLFSPAGLENIFRPPPQIPSPFRAPEISSTEDIAMPSSPPPYAIGNRSQSKSSSTVDMGEEKYGAASKELRAMQYKMVDTGSQQFSEDSLSRSSSFHPMCSAFEKEPRENEHNIISDGAPEQFGLSSESSINIEAIRVVSGQSDVRHEDLSPIYISRHNTVDGRIDYSVLDLPAAELQQRLENLPVNGKLRSSESSEGISQLLHRDASSETEEFKRIGEFVNLGRGGQSEESSFHQRMLSPSSLPIVDESGMLCETSVEASTPKNLPSFREQDQMGNSEILSLDSVLPKVSREPILSLIRDENSNSGPESGSPLKLFGTYDTYTNQKLLRRLSQFENNMPRDGSRHNLGSSKSEEPKTESTSQIGMNDAFIAPSSPPKKIRQASRGISRFGDGGLDQFEFSESSLESNRDLLVAVGESVAASPQSTGLNVGFSFHLQPSPSLETGTMGQWRTRRINTTLKERNVATRRASHLIPIDLNASSSPSISHQLEVLDTPRKRNGDSEGKRLLHSPTKNPTPKRRRTLHITDISHAALDGRMSDFVKESHEQIQSVICKKRKDARHGDNQEAADPQILAMRQILRPRTPTPNQRSYQSHKRGGFSSPRGSDSGRAELEQKEKIARVQAELDATAPSLTSVSVRMGKPMYSDSRKGSVTTQDFLDEAKRIMAGIRGKARPSSGLASVEESDSEHGKPFSASQGPDQDESYEDSTKEPFSRPPSRDGGPLPRLLQRQQDPEVLDYLKKYEEMSDMDGVIASSMKSIGLAKDVINAANDINLLAGESLNKLHSQDLDMDQEYQSDPPNIRITEYPELQRKRKHSTSSLPVGTTSNHDADFPSQGSNESSGTSTGRSVPTGSSRGSDSKHIIAPHTVSHLIPEQLAGMIFDREKRIWVKQKVVSGEQEHDDKLCAEDTDDDPFGDIPDLTVDETQELSRVKAVAAQKREEARISAVQRYHSHEQDIDQLVDGLSGAMQRDSAAVDVDNTAPAEPSKLTRLASSPTAQVTRPTSWSDASGVPDPPPSGVDHEPTLRSRDTDRDLAEEVEQEISIHESRVEYKKHTPRRRNVTISFSSPLASIIPSDVYDETKTDEDTYDRGSILIHESNRQRSHLVQSRSIQHTGSRKQRLAGRSFLARPVSRIDEHDEQSLMGSTEEGSPRRSVSIMISTPLPARTSTDNGSVMPASSVARYTEGILQLTPLSDFSVNQHDESFALEVSYIGQRWPQRSSNTGKRSLSLSVKELVQRITDIEPYEPFWEHLKKLELRGKTLQSLHMMSKFCSQLEELDVSDNDIGQLDGAPGTIRNLRITHNCLSDLSSWVHLSNLQYVDVSNNALTSLEGLKHLVHLRSLRADNNKIQSLEGITTMDGLISLRLRGNLVQYVDFAGSLLQRLTDLDFKGNCVREIHNLHELRSLTTLNLEDNDIQTFTRENCENMWALKYLKLGGNKLEHLDITQYPNIRLLYLDRNRLGRITGLLKAKHLDSLSLREQQLGFSINQSFLNEALEVRKLFLSGNFLTTFQASVDFLNLQYLELANCGLETLPIEFGQMTPNLRVLNLNFNAIRDIKPLLGIPRLKKLHLAGNRLSRLRKTTNVLAQFSSLTRADLRNNPLTLGFYPPPSEKRIVIHDGVDDECEVLRAHPFTLVLGDRDGDVAYAGRLDMETRMRRRVYEMLVLGGCARLKMLDGLLLDRSCVVIRDKVWEELVKAELVYDGVGEAPADDDVEPHISEAAAERVKGDLEGVEDEDPKSDFHANPVWEERWQAEDSFA